MARQKRPTLDLHGYKAEEVAPTVDRFISQHSHQEEVLIIVGRGQGIVRQKTIEWLKGAHYPYRYEKTKGVENLGALIVDLY